jgi:tRNA A-37 threonylcarbamoyl transferase component Bud32
VSDTHTAHTLREAGRTPPLPLTVRLQDGRPITLHRLLRVLPGKRIVGEAEFEGRRVLAKLFIAAGSVRHWQRERRGIEALAHHHIPTPGLLHAGELQGGGHALLTAFLDDAVSLDARWQAVADLPAGNPQAFAVLSPAFAMLGRLHAHGLVQEDLHLGNFLLVGGTLQVIDGDAIRTLTQGDALDGMAASANFAVLAAQIPSAWDEFLPELVAAWRQADTRLPALDPDPLRAQVQRTRAARVDAFLPKTVRDCTLFKVVKRFDRFTAVVRDEAEVLAPLLADPNRLLEAGRILKDGGTCTVGRIELDGRSLVIKRYNLKSAGHALSRALRPSRAWHSWVEGHRLAFLGIATPAPLALIEERLGPLRRRAWLVNSLCPGPNLRDHLAPYVASGPPTAEAEALRSLFATLHRERISHGDMKATNLLWQDGRVVLIDLDAMTQHRSDAAHARAWRKDRARLLRNWPAESALYRWLDTHLPAA